MLSHKVFHYCQTVGQCYSQLHSHADRASGYHTAAAAASPRCTEVRAGRPRKAGAAADLGKTLHAEDLRNLATIVVKGACRGKHEEI